MDNQAEPQKLTPADMARKAHAVKMERYGVQIYKDMGKKGAATNLKKGPKYFSQLGKKSAITKLEKKLAKLLVMREAARDNKHEKLVSSLDINIADTKKKIANLKAQLNGKAKPLHTISKFLIGKV